MIRTMWLALALLGCPAPEPAPDAPPVQAEWALNPAPPVCDAGDHTWVMRTMPLVWGRKPHGAFEVELWAQMAQEHGREAVVRAMALDPQYVAHWRDWLTDALYVARSGDKLHDRCFGRTNLDTHDGTLTAHLLANAPNAQFTQNFTMGDVIVDALVADDVSTVYQAHLYARMSRPVVGANVSAEELEYNARVNFGELFLHTYLGRNLECMVCHNSEFSVTDHPDPALDRTWQLPGLFERALWGQSAGLGADQTYSVFRTAGVVGPGPGRVRPWSMARACGQFVPPQDLPTEDFIGQSSSFFVEELGPTGSIHQLERYFAQGVSSLRNQGLTLSDDGAVDGPESFAYLVAANLADQVWQAGTGHRLTIAHHFPRTQPQAARLQGLADRFAASGFSLRDLLVAVTNDDHFNPGLRMSCRAQDYGLDRIFDPWTDAEEIVERRANTVGDLAHRLPARSLLRTAHRNLGWPERPAWPDNDPFFESAEALFQEELGVFLRESSPGRVGSDLQGLLAWERAYGACDQRVGDDIVARMVQRAVEAEATLSDLAHAIKDRLTSQALDWQETLLVSEFFELGPDHVVTADPTIVQRARLYCGAVLLSPQFQMVTDDAVGWPPRLALGRAEDCEQVAELMSAVGAPVTCSDGRLTSASEEAP